MEEYIELEREMREKNLAPSSPHVKPLFLGWFEPLKEAIEAEQKSQGSKKHQAMFVPNIDVLPTKKWVLLVVGFAYKGVKKWSLVLFANDKSTSNSDEEGKGEPK
ncbi:hypothetical protein SESBI_06293 [Sesbania bispinosa]|nr:hypothetical protein SESBI_06293 [Sesbania bispinosa]